MSPSRQKRSVEEWNGVRVAPGECRDLPLKVSESYSGMTISIPVQVRRGPTEGPVVFVTAALHGNEINGTGAIRTLIQDELPLRTGALILVPVLNLLAFDRHSRYLPDRRDLNRCFPGSPKGSLAARMAWRIFDEIVARCDYGIDLHTAAVYRTNFPNVRGDLSRPDIKQLAEQFGCEIIVNGRGPRGSLRQEACRAGCPTIMLEAGETCKVEPAIVECTVRGVRNILVALGMIDGQRRAPSYQLTIEKSKWVRAERGGFMQFHATAGDVVTKGTPLATNTDLLGRDRNTLTAPFDGIVLGMTTLPAVSPGEPVYHLGALPEDGRKPDYIRRMLAGHPLHERIHGDLASNVLQVEPKPSNDD